MVNDYLCDGTTPPDDRKATRPLGGIGDGLRRFVDAMVCDEFSSIAPVTIGARVFIVILQLDGVLRFDFEVPWVVSLHAPRGRKSGLLSD
jgi:hypothetical protein